MTDHSKKLELSPENRALQRAIARRIKRGLPLAGLLAAALFCGCGEEQPGPRPLMGVPAPPPEKQTEASPPDNRPNELPPAAPTNGVPVPSEANPPDNSGNENKRPMVDGLMPKKKADK